MSAPDSVEELLTFSWPRDRTLLLMLVIYISICIVRSCPWRSGYLRVNVPAASRDRFDSPVRGRVSGGNLRSRDDCAISCDTRLVVNVLETVEGWNLPVAVRQYPVSALMIKYSAESPVPATRAICHTALSLGVERSRGLQVEVNTG